MRAHWMTDLNEISPLSDDKQAGQLQQDVLNVQEWVKKHAPGLLIIAPVVATHFCLKLLGQFLQPGARLLAELCEETAISSAEVIFLSGYYWTRIIMKK